MKRDRRHNCRCDDEIHYAPEYCGPTHFHSREGVGPNGDWFNIIEAACSDSSGTYILKIQDKFTKDILYTSPNLHAGRIFIQQEDDVVHFYITRNGQRKLLSDIKLPNGKDGSYIFTSDLENIEVYDSLIYTFDYENLIYDGNVLPHNIKPNPRELDTVVAHITKVTTGEEFFAAGTIFWNSPTQKKCRVLFRTLCPTLSGSAVVHADYAETDSSKPGYILHRDEIQRALLPGEYISLDAIGNIDVNNLAQHQDIDNIFN